MGPRAANDGECIWYAEVISIYPRVSQIYTLCCSVHLQYLCIPVQAPPSMMLNLSPSFFNLRNPPASYPLSNYIIVVVRNELFPHNCIQVHLQVLSIGVDMCFFNYGRVLSVARFNFCIHIEMLRSILHAMWWFKESCDFHNDESDRQNGFWLWNLKIFCS